jgi:hypothetical protein
VLRRVVLPMREVLNTLLRRDLPTVDATMAPNYQDVYDHVLRATEWTESLRDLVATTVETDLTVQANRMNLIMKMVTSWAAIIAVPTAITGFYGQNLPYPGYATHWGFAASTASSPPCPHCSSSPSNERLALTARASAPRASSGSPGASIGGPLWPGLGAAPVGLRSRKPPSLNGAERAAWGRCQAPASGTVSRPCLALPATGCYTVISTRRL